MKRRLFHIADCLGIELAGRNVAVGVDTKMCMKSNTFGIQPLMLARARHKSLLDTPPVVLLGNARYER